MGIVKWFSDIEGYGFIEAGTGVDYFVHHSGLLGEGFRSLAAGQKVSFNVQQVERAAQAVEVEVL